MEKFSFFDAEKSGDTYDRLYSSEDMAAYFNSFIDTGIFVNPASSLQVVADSNLNIMIKQGKGWIKGYFYELNEADKQISIERGDNANPRIDRIVLSLNLSKRLIEIKVLKGTAAGNPQPVNLTRTATQYDLCLAEIKVAAGCTAITQDMIKDTRFDKALCGVVKGVVDEIDTTTLFKQYDSQFNSWFEGVKGTLDGDAAGNLKSQIDALKSKHDADVKTATDSINGNKSNITKLQNRIKFGTGAAPTTGEPNSIYIQLL